MPPVFPTPRRPGAEDLERHRFLTESIQSLIRRSEINSAAVELFSRFDTESSGSISARDFCSIVQQIGVTAEVAPSELWAAVLKCLPRSTGAHAGGLDEGYVRLNEFRKFYGRWLESPSSRSKLSRKLRAKISHMQKRRTNSIPNTNTVRRPVRCTELNAVEPEQFEDSIEEYIELGPDDQLGRMRRSTLVMDLIAGYERLESEKADLRQQLNSALVDGEVTKHQLELDKRGLVVLLARETEMRHNLEKQLAAKQEQWSGRGLGKLSDVELSALLRDVDDAATKIRKEEQTRSRKTQESLVALERDLMCPIGHDLYQDPVVAADGAHCYSMQSKLR